MDFYWYVDRLLLLFQDDATRALVFLLQLLTSVILGLLAWTHYSPTSLVKVQGKVENVSLRQFAWCWRLLWCGWTIRYSFLFLQQLAVNANSKFLEPAHLQSIIDVITCVDGYILFVAYLALTKDSVSLLDAPNRNRPFLWWMTGAGAVCAAVCTLAVCERTGAWNLHRCAVLAVGLYTSLGMAFFVSPFTSQWMKAPTSVLCLLYTYAILRVTYSYFYTEQYGGIEAIIYFLFWPLKIFLFTTVTLLCYKGRLGTHLREARRWKQRSSHNDLLRGASEKLEQGDPRGAYADFSANAEWYLKQLCKKHKIAIPEQNDKRPIANITEMANRLRQHGVIDKAEESQLKAYSPARKASVHSISDSPPDDDSPHPALVQSHIDTFRDFMDRMPIAEAKQIQR